jgi:hypothetical protein
VGKAHEFVFTGTRTFISMSRNLERRTDYSYLMDKMNVLNLMIVNLTENIKMCLEAQHREMFSDDNTFEEKDKVDKKKVTFKDEDEIFEIRTEYQIWKMEDAAEEDVEVENIYGTFETRTKDGI